MISMLSFLMKFNPSRTEFDLENSPVNEQDESHAINVALSTSALVPYVLLEKDGEGMAFDSESSLLSWYINSDFSPILVDGADRKIYLDRISASVKSYSYDAGTLRKFFNRIEYYCYLICKFRVHKGDRFYKPDSDTQSDRIKILVSRSLISQDERSVLNELANCRNIFAHTLIDIEDITFRGEELKNVLVSTNYESHKVISQTMHKLITEYDKIAYQQVDWDEFINIFEAIINHIIFIKSED